MYFGNISLLRVTKIISVSLQYRKVGGAVTENILLIRNEYLSVEKFGSLRMLEPGLSSSRLIWLAHSLFNISASSVWNIVT